MKKILLSLLFLAILSPAIAQMGGPDQFGYIWRDTSHAQGPDFNWIDITAFPGASPVTGLADDNTVGFFSIGFPFHYYWYDVTQFKIGSNGYIIFNANNISSPFPPIPVALDPNDYIAAYMSDLNFSGPLNPAQCWFWSNQTDSMIISYINVPFWTQNSPGYIGSNTFQMILTSVDSSITFQYKSLQGTSSIVDFLTVGIENNSGSVGLLHTHDVYGTDSTAIKFYYPSNTTFIVSDASVVYNDNPTTGGIFLSKDGAGYTLTNRIQNSGNTALSTYNVLYQVQNSLGTVVLTESFNSTSSVPGQSEDFSSTTPFLPTIADKYSFLSFTELIGDATPTNDMKELEVNVIDTTQTFFTLGYTGDLPIGGGISWSGGDAGIGIEIVPPFYPIYLRQLEFYIAANANAVGMHGLVYDNTGPNNTHGNLLDSVGLAGSQILTDAWNTLTLTTPLLINSGSVFIAWMMDGDGITLGLDNTLPIANRSYEVLGSWDVYRDRQTQDPMMRVVATGSATANVNDITPVFTAGEFFPSPSDGNVWLQLNSDIVTGKKITLSFYNMQGQLSAKKEFSSSGGRQGLSVNLSGLAAGVYNCHISDGKQDYYRKLVISN